MNIPSTTPSILKVLSLNAKIKKFVVFFHSPLRKKLLWGVGILLTATLIWIVRTPISFTTLDPKNDFSQARQITERCLQGEPLSLEGIGQLEKILKKHHELHPAYDHLLAAIHFSENRIEEALHYEQIAHQRIVEHLPLLYQKYNGITLKIARSDYAGAFDETENLLSALNALDPAEAINYQNLYACTLVRQIFLAGKLGFKETQKKGWELLRTHPTFLEIEHVFQEGKFSLSEYMETTFRNESDH